MHVQTLVSLIPDNLSSFRWDAGADNLSNEIDSIFSNSLYDSFNFLKGYRQVMSESIHTYHEHLPILTDELIKNRSLSLILLDISAIQRHRRTIRHSYLYLGAAAAFCVAYRSVRQRLSQGRYSGTGRSGRIAHFVISKCAAPRVGRFLRESQISACSPHERSDP